MDTLHQNANAYVELALPLTNSRGFAKIIRFDCLLPGGPQLPLIVCPHLAGTNINNPYVTRQAVYFASDIDCIIRLHVPDRNTEPSRQELKEYYLSYLQKIADDCLLEYSLHNNASMLTARSDRTDIPIITELSTTWHATSSPHVEYCRVDTDKVSLLTPRVSDFIEEAFQDYVASILPGAIDYAENKTDYRLVLSQEDNDFEGTPPILFHELPLSYEDLKFIGSIIPLNTALYDEQGEFLSTATDDEKGKECIITAFNGHLQEISSSPTLAKMPEWEIIRVQKTYNPILLDFYFSGLRSLSPFIEFRSYYTIPSPKLTANKNGFCGTVGVLKRTQRKAHISHGRYSTIALLPVR